MRINRFLFHVAADLARLPSLECSNSASISAKQNAVCRRETSPDFTIMTRSPCDLIVAAQFRKAEAENVVPARRRCNGRGSDGQAFKPTPETGALPIHRNFGAFSKRISRRTRQKAIRKSQQPCDQQHN